MKNKCTTTCDLTFNTYTYTSNYCFKHALRQVRCTWCSLYSFLVSLDNNSLHSHSGFSVLFWIIHFLLNTKIWFTCRVPNSGGKILQWLGLHLKWLVRAREVYIGCKMISIAFYYSLDDLSLIDMFSSIALVSNLFFNWVQHLFEIAVTQWDQLYRIESIDI